LACCSCTSFFGFGSSLVTLGLELLRVSGSPFRLYVSDKFSEKYFVFLIVFLEVHSLKKF